MLLKKTSLYLEKQMTKAELLNVVSAKVEGMTKKQATEVVDAVFEALTEAICKDGGSRFAYPGFGTFNVKERAARAGRNPRTNEPIKIAAGKSVSFKAAPKLKAALNVVKVEEKKADKKADKKEAPKKEAAKKETAKKSKK